MKILANVDLFTNVADPGNDGERGNRGFKEGVRRVWFFVLSKMAVPLKGRDDING